MTKPQSTSVTVDIQAAQDSSFGDWVPYPEWETSNQDLSPILSPHIAYVYIGQRGPPSERRLLTLLMSPSLQASTSDLSLSAVPAEDAAEADPEVGAPAPVAPLPPAPPPGGSERIRVRAAAASSRAHETEEVRRFRTCERGRRASVCKGRGTLGCTHEGRQREKLSAFYFIS